MSVIYKCYLKSTNNMHIVFVGKWKGMDNENCYHAIISKNK